MSGKWEGCLSEKWEGGLDDVEIAVASALYDNGESLSDGYGYYTNPEGWRTVIRDITAKVRSAIERERLQEPAPADTP